MDLVPLKDLDHPREGRGTVGVDAGRVEYDRLVLGERGDQAFGAVGPTIAGVAAATRMTSRSQRSLSPSLSR